MGGSRAPPNPISPPRTQALSLAPLRVGSALHLAYPGVGESGDGGGRTGLLVPLLLLLPRSRANFGRVWGGRKETHTPPGSPWGAGLGRGETDGPSSGRARRKRAAPASCWGAPPGWSGLGGRGGEGAGLGREEGRSEGAGGRAGRRRPGASERRPNGRKERVSGEGAPGTPIPPPCAPGTPDPPNTEPQSSAGLGPMSQVSGQSPPLCDAPHGAPSAAPGPGRTAGRQVLGRWGGCISPHPPPETLEVWVGTGGPLEGERRAGPARRRRPCQLGSGPSPSLDPPHTPQRLSVRLGLESRLFLPSV